MRRKGNAPKRRKQQLNAMLCPHCGDVFAKRRPFINADGVELAYVHEDSVCTSDRATGQAVEFADCYIDADA